MKVFVRTKNIPDKFAERVPFNYNIELAMEGFREFGFEIFFYDNVSEIYDYYSRGDIVLDGIEQVEYCLNKFNIKPPSWDYPEPLKEYLGRNIWYDTINHINCNPSLWGCFVKPVKEKAFTGRVINSPKDLIGCGNHSENYEVICSDAVDFIFEARGLFYYNDLVDLRPYKGDWRLISKLDTSIIDEAVKKYTDWDNKINGCTLDWGLTKDGRTLLIESNLGFAFAPYSTDCIAYAKIISACISQLSNVPDECHFCII